MMGISNEEEKTCMIKFDLGSTANKQQLAQARLGLCFPTNTSLVSAVSPLLAKLLRQDQPIEGKSNSNACCDDDP